LGAFLLSRLGVFLFSSVPFGFDTGIYRYEMWQSFQSLPEYVSGLFLGLPLITNIVQLGGFSLDHLLLGGVVSAALLAIMSLALFVFQRWGKREATLVLRSLLLLITGQEFIQLPRNL